MSGTNRIPIILLAASLAACNGGEDASAPPAAAEKPVVAVVNYPLRYFAERIAGDLIQVFFPAPANVDPAHWAPSGAERAEYRDAALILLNGADFAKWVTRAELPPAKLVDTSAGFRDEYIEVQEAVVHSHGSAGEHSHAGTAFTTWLDPTLAIRQAEAIEQALSRLLPGKASVLGANLQALRRDLEGLDADFREALSPEAGRPLVASHPVYQYFARRYGLRLKSLHWEPDETPDEKEWAKLDLLLETHPAKRMIWEAEPTPETAAGLAERGIGVAVVEPCGNAPTQGDFLEVMRRNASRLAEVFR